MSKNDLKLFNFFLLCIVLLGLISALQQVRFPKLQWYKEIPEPVATTTPRLTYVPQFVLISFDGARDNNLWKDLREFKVALKGEGKRVNYTFFINTAYLLTEDTRNFYIGPRHSPGKTNIGLSSGIEDVRTRIHEINAAIALGDEIAPHTTGHFSGLGWSKDEWKTELDSFDAILFGLDKLYPDAGLPKLNLKPEDTIGFRAPYLETSPGLYEMMHENPRYRYESSAIQDKDVWPTKDASGLWRIPLGTMRLENGTKPILAMDYNHYVHDSKAVDRIKKGSDEWNRRYADTLAGWLAYFNRNYSQDRVPVLMGYHYGLWNDGLYWEVMKAFAREVCGKPEVHCGTFRELVDYMDEYGVPKKE